MNRWIVAAAILGLASFIGGIWGLFVDKPWKSDSHNWKTAVFVCAGLGATFAYIFDAFYVAGLKWGSAANAALVLVIAFFSSKGKSRLIAAMFTAALVLAIFGLYVFPLHRGDGRSTSYNNGWEYIAIYTPDGAVTQFGNPGSCLQLFLGERQVHKGGFGPYDNESEWVKGCKDAIAADRQAITETTTPTIPMIP